MTGPLGWIRRRSQTLDLLVRLLSHLPAQRRRTLLQLLPFSVLPGLTDLALVAVGARMVGSLVGTRLADNLPGVKVFGGNQIDQSLLMWQTSCCNVNGKRVLGSILVVRMVRPAKVLMIGACIALSSSTMIAMFWPLSYPDNIETEGLLQSPPYTLEVSPGRKSRHIF